MTNSVEKCIDLRGTPCPVNFIRCKLILEGLSPRDRLKVNLDRGEPEEMVVSGLKSEGHFVEMINSDTNSVQLLVIAGGK